MAPVVVYGTPAQVAALASMWTRGGLWVDPVGPVPGPADKGTNPSLTQVTEWLVNVSAQMNLALGNANFIVPFYDDATPDSKVQSYLALSQYVSSIVADLAHYKNSSGRFFTEKVVERGVNPMQAILKDMAGWIALNERGLIADGLLQFPVQLTRNFPQFRTLGSFPNRRIR